MASEIATSIKSVLREQWPKVPVYLGEMNQDAKLPCFFIFTPESTVHRRLWGAMEREVLCQVVYLIQQWKTGPPEGRKFLQEETAAIGEALVRLLGRLRLPLDETGVRRVLTPREVTVSSDEERAQVQFRLCWRERWRDEEEAPNIQEAVVQGAK